jgi:hypothetical protein
MARPAEFFMEIIAHAVFFYDSKSKLSATLGRHMAFITFQVRLVFVVLKNDRLSFPNNLETLL